MFTKRAIPVWLIISWSLLVHLPGITSPLRDYHAYRQCQTASMARNYVRYGMEFLSPRLDTEGRPVRAGTEFPIYSYLLAILFRLFGVRDILGRLLSCLFAAWGAVYLYRFIIPRLGQRIALWSALVMCSIPVHIYFTRTVQPEPMALWGFLGFLYYGDRWFRDRKKTSWIMALVLGTLAPLLKLSFIYLIIPAWFFLEHERADFKHHTRAQWRWLMALILLATGAWYHYAKTASVVILPLTLSDHWTNLAPILTWRLWRAQFISRIPELVTTYSGIFLAGVGVYYFRRAKSFLFLYGWLAASVLYTVLLGEYGLIHRYALLPLAPMAAVWIACGISMLWEHARSRWFWRLLFVILVLGIPVHAAFRIAHWYRIEYTYLSRAHDKLAVVSHPDDLVLVLSHEKPQMLYYLDRYGYALDPESWRVEDLNLKFSQGAHYVFVPIEDNLKRLNECKTFLKKRAKLIENDPDYLLYRVP